MEWGFGEKEVKNMILYFMHVLIFINYLDSDPKRERICILCLTNFQNRKTQIVILSSFICYAEGDL